MEKQTNPNEMEIINEASHETNNPNPDNASDQKLQKWSSSPDRLTQLQENLRNLVINFYSFIGVIQRDAEPLKANQNARAIQNQGTSNEINLEHMAKEIVSTSKFINTLIESLPGGSSTSQDQLNQLSVLEEENLKAAQILQIRAQKAQELLEKVQNALQLLSKFE